MKLERPYKGFSAHHLDKFHFLASSLISILTDPNSNPSVGILSTHIDESMPCNGFIFVVNLDAFASMPEVQEAFVEFRNASMEVMQRYGGSKA
jgi:hypothetical protein